MYNNKQLCNIFTQGTEGSFIIFALRPIKTLAPEIHFLISVIDVNGIYFSQQNNHNFLRMLDNVKCTIF